MKKIFLIILLILISFMPAYALDRILEWTAPTLDADGVPLSQGELAGYYIYYGTAPNTYGHVININNPAALTYTFNNLPEQDHYFAMTAYSTSTNVIAGCSVDSVNISNGWGTSGTDVLCTDNMPIVPGYTAITYNTFCTERGMTCIQQNNTIIHESALTSEVSMTPCTSFDYSAWASCQNNINTRTITASYASGCYGTDNAESLFRLCSADNADPSISILIQRVYTHKIIPKRFPEQLRYSLTHPSEALTLSLKYDSDNAGYDGAGFVNCQSLVGGLMKSCTINTDIPAGLYYFYGESVSLAGANHVYIPEPVIISDCTQSGSRACVGSAKVVRQ